MQYLFITKILLKCNKRVKQKTLSGDEYSVVVLEEKDIKDKILNVKQSKVFHKETYIEESKKRHQEHIRKKNLNKTSTRKHN